MRFGFYRAALLIGAASVLVPTGAAAQRDLDQENSDVRVFQGNVDSAAAEFRVSVPANSVMQIDVLTTSELDPIVTVTDAGTGETLAEDDDGGDNLNARVRIPGEARGRNIVIAVDSYDSTWVEDGETYGGTFDLRLSNSTFVPHRTRAVTYGARESGTMNAGEANTYTFRAAAGDRVEIALISAEGGTLDPYLELQDASGQVLVSNDDSNGLNSYINHVFADAGTYTIAAKGYGSSTGDYVLRVRDRRDVPATTGLQTIAIGGNATGEIAPGFMDENYATPNYVDYRLSDAAKAAIRGGNGGVTIRMDAVESSDPDFGGSIDPYVTVGFDTPLGFAQVAEDDDGSGTLNALLPIDLGLIADRADLLDLLRIRVQGLGGGGGGYTLSMTEGMEERQGYDSGMDGEYPSQPPIITTAN
ncbi:hypothetical protein GRI62_03675 [Erythrobacter arachoides]|uniref:Peptidase C-terminal archaeal/bacterial domain-containing protein n=1 Tax=Aurantiacibacter arachoides TaxID=1850444 RepID=A0A845A0P6_9SPHN|nr:PPC domain-containing protein [Aurantiacibacter arachoides]MXO92706.1 hypothetical protein [Aurantiacibacter arachoides]GGD55092.1 hypothetical protein GCM10011411_13820 [Aurantiacibacter arachoides]